MRSLATRGPKEKVLTEKQQCLLSTPSSFHNRRKVEFIHGKDAIPRRCPFRL